MTHTRRCPRCKDDLPITAFGPNKQRVSGRNSYCVPCARLSGKDVRFRQRLKALQHYSGPVPKCACCGESNLEFLCFDHINGGGRKHIATIPSRNLGKWLAANEYPDGFRVLCHNCNMSLGFHGYCPHTSQSKLDARGVLQDKRACGEGNANAKLSNEAVVSLRAAIAAGTKSRAELAKEFGVSWSTVDRIKSGKSRARSFDPMDLL